MSALDELCKEVLALNEKAKDNWSIDLYRTLNQPIEKRLPIEHLIHNYRTSAPLLAKACREMKKALEYCAIERSLLHPQNNAQYAVAMNCLADVDAELVAQMKKEDK